MTKYVIFEGQSIELGELGRIMEKRYSDLAAVAIALAGYVADDLDPRATSLVDRYRASQADYNAAYEAFAAHVSEQ